MGLSSVKHTDIIAGLEIAIPIWMCHKLAVKPGASAPPLCFVASGVRPGPLCFVASGVDKR